MEKTLRIAIIRQRYTPFGGAERFVENALNALQQERSIELTLITRKWKGADNPNIKKIICNPFYILAVSGVTGHLLVLLVVPLIKKILI